MKSKRDPFSKLVMKLRDNFPRTSKVYYFYFVLKFIPLYCLTHLFVFSVNTFHNNFIQQFFIFTSSNTVSFYIMNNYSILGYYLAIYSINIISLAFFCLLYFIQVRKKHTFLLEEEKLEMQRSIKARAIKIFAVFIFIRYFLLSHFFYEAYFFPMICFNNSLEKIKLYYNYTKFDFLDVCNNQNVMIYILLAINIINFLFEVYCYFILLFKFFSMNIFSTFPLNFYPKIFLSPFFTETLIQVLYVFILFFDFSKSNIIFISSMSISIFSLILRILTPYEFVSINNSHLVTMFKYSQLIYFIGFALSIIFWATGISIDNESLLLTMIFEFLIAMIFRRILSRSRDKNLENFFVFNKITETNIYTTVSDAVIEFYEVYNWIYHRPERLYFLKNLMYQHYKSCADEDCICKGLTTNATLQQFGDFLNESYNKDRNSFFETHFLNNQFKDLIGKKLNEKQRFILSFMKRLIIFKFGKLLNGSYDDFAKQFIILNHMAFLVEVNNYFFQPYITITDIFLKTDVKNQNPSVMDRNKIAVKNLTFLFYFKRFLKRRYKKFLVEMQKWDNTIIYNEALERFKTYSDMQSVFYLYEVNYEIEVELLQSTNLYGQLIESFNKSELSIERFIECLTNFKNKHEDMVCKMKRIRKIQTLKNIFISTKLRLYYKLLDFEPPGFLKKDYFNNNQIQYTHSITELNEHLVLIIKYENENYIIKHMSHELIIMLEYTEDEVKDKDMHILLPHQMKSSHKILITDEISSKDMFNYNSKEIFLTAKTGNCLLFSLKYKFSLNYKGEVSIFCFLSNKEYFASKSHSIGFICVDSKFGQVICMNREFEDNCYVNKGMLDYINYDAKKLILQNSFEKIHEFFKTPENIRLDFEFKFDYDEYLSSLQELDFNNLIEKGITNVKKENFQSIFGSTRNLTDLPNSQSIYQVSGKSGMTFGPARPIQRSENIYNKFKDTKAVITMRCMGMNKFYFVKIFFNNIVKNYLDVDKTSSFLKALCSPKKESIPSNPFTIKVSTKNEEEKAEENQIFRQNGLLDNYLKNPNKVKIILEKDGKKNVLEKETIGQIEETRLQSLFTYFTIILFFLLASIGYNMFCLFYKEEIFNENRNIFSLDYYSFRLKSKFIMSLGPMISLIIKWNGLEPNVNPNHTSDYVLNYYSDVMKNSTQDYIWLFSRYDNILSYFGEKYNETLSSIYLNKSEYRYIFTDGSEYSLNKNDYSQLAHFHIIPFSIYHNLNGGNFQTNIGVLYSSVNSVLNKTTADVLSTDQHFYFFMNNYFTNFNSYFKNSFEIINSIFEDYIAFSKKYCIIITVGEVILMILSIISQQLLLRDSYNKISKKIIEIAIIFRLELKDKQTKLAAFLMFMQKYDYDSYKIVMGQFDFNTLSTAPTNGNNLTKDDKFFERLIKSNKMTPLSVGKKNSNDITTIPSLPRQAKKSKVLNGQVLPGPGDSSPSGGNTNYLNVNFKPMNSSFGSNRNVFLVTDSNKVPLDKVSPRNLDSANYPPTDGPPVTTYEENVTQTKDHRSQTLGKNESMQQFNILETLAEKGKARKKAKEKMSRLKDDTIINKTDSQKPTETSNDISFIIADKLLVNNRNGIITLTLFSLIFLGLYVFMIIFHNFTFQKLIKVNEVSYNIQMLLPSFEEIVLLYRKKLLQNSTDLSELAVFNASFQSIHNKFEAMMIDSDYRVMNSTFATLDLLSTDKMCEYLSNYGASKGKDKSFLMMSCLGGYNGINKMGFMQSIRTMKQNIESLIKEFSSASRTRESMLARINDTALANVNYIMEFTLRNAELIISESIEKDVVQIFDQIVFIEKIFSVLTIILNFIFLLFSVVLIIDPIRILNTKFFWILNKIYHK